MMSGFLGETPKPPFTITLFQSRNTLTTLWLGQSIVLIFLALHWKVPHPGKLSEKPNHDSFI
jgi:hypothetical protein